MSILNNNEKLSRIDKYLNIILVPLGIAVILICLLNFIGILDILSIDIFFYIIFIAYTVLGLIKFLIYKTIERNKHSKIFNDFLGISKEITDKNKSNL